MRKPGEILLMTGIMLLSVALAGCRSRDMAVTIGSSDFELAGQRYILSLQLQDAEHIKESEPGPLTGFDWMGQGQMIVTEADSGEVCTVYKMQEWDEPLYFPEELEITFCDYNGDGALEFLIGQYGGSTFNLYRMYGICGDADNLEIRYYDNVGELAISGVPLSPVLEQTEDGAVHYSSYDNARGEFVEKSFIVQ